MMNKRDFLLQLYPVAETEGIEFLKGVELDFINIAPVSFAVEMLADWGVASSLCEMLWNQAENSPNTPYTNEVVDPQPININ